MANFPSSLDDSNSLYVLANNALTYLEGSLDSSGGNNGQSASIDVEDGSVFPATAGFFLVGTEIIKYTSRVSNKLIGITRGYGGSTARSHCQRPKGFFPSHRPGLSARQRGQKRRFLGRYRDRTIQSQGRRHLAHVRIRSDL